jgi:hypothetical protein
MGSTKGRLWICRASAWNEQRALVPQTHSLYGGVFTMSQEEISNQRMMLEVVHLQRLRAALQLCLYSVAVQ